MTELEMKQQLEKELELKRKLKYYSYIIKCITQTTEYQVVRGVALNFDQAYEILNKWNDKCEQEKKHKLECIAIVEGDYFRSEYHDKMIVPTTASKTKRSKYTRDELYDYYKHLCEVLNMP